MVKNSHSSENIHKLLKLWLELHIQTPSQKSIIYLQIELSRRADFNMFVLFGADLPNGSYDQKPCPNTRKVMVYANDRDQCHALYLKNFLIVVLLFLFISDLLIKSSDQKNIYRQNQ